MARLAVLFPLLLVVAAIACPIGASAVAETLAGPAPHALQAQEGGGGSPFGDAPGSGWSAVVIWSLVSVLIFSAVMGVFYFLKRQLGGFPDNPSWVAPITIMASEDFPDEGDFGEAEAGHTAGH